jgi:hypothetical protein
MRNARLGAIAIAILAMATIVWAQKPDFSGTWTLDPGSASAARGALGNGPVTVKQTADALTIERTAGDADLTLIFKLDGSQSRNLMTGPGGQTADTASVAKWDGPRLTIVTRREVEGQVVETTQVWSVEGNTLTVETTGPRGRQKHVYNK